MKFMPQEIEVRYVIPSLRKELSKELHRLGHKQKDVAKLLDLTPSAVSQYLKNKRGTLNFNSKVQKEIKSSSKKIINNPEVAYKELFKLTKSIRDSKEICNIHRKYDDVPKKCNIRF